MVAPARWREQLRAIELARVRRDAPVDYLGCHTLGEPADGAANFRFQTLIALMLSVRTKDEVVAAAMQRLRALVGGDDGVLSAAAVANLDAPILLRAIDGVTFAGTKAPRVLEVARSLVAAHDGDVPREYEELTALPGVGPKVAHLLLHIGFDDVRGIAVDSHVDRIARRVGWAGGAKSPEATRKQLEAWMPRELWRPLNPLLVGFGQQLCSDRAPQCERCPLGKGGLCEYNLT